MIKTVYITGCLGFIGSYVTRACLEKGWYVRGVDKMTYASRPELLEEFNKYKNFSFEKIDIVDMKGLYECDYVINTAAESHVDNSIVKSDDFIHSNIVGVHNLLELIRTVKKEKMPIFLHFSTDEVYGDIAEGSHIETDLLKPSNPYSATKAAADQLVLAWGRTYKVPYVIVRPTNNYGIGQYVEKLIPKACKYLTLGKKIPLHDNGTPVRIWLHAKDTASAIIKIIESGVKNEIYNISGNFETQNIEVVNKILEHMEIDTNIYLGPGEPIGKDSSDYIDTDFSRQGQDIRYSIDDNKLKALGWNNECNFYQELPHIVKYYKDNFVW
jgi:dTDP-glucose 4,6-dehydratase|tara:strand:- start:270 stop:1250 length:981 start_codon:yes stop_codon:yes gene_type:complete